MESTLSGVSRSYRVDFNSDNPLNPFARLRAQFQQVRARLDQEQHGERPLKYYLALKVDFFKSSDCSTVTNPPPVFLTETAKLLAGTNIDRQLEILLQSLLHQIDSYEGDGSGWVLLSLVSLQLDLIEFIPLRASSFIPTPPEIAKRGG